MAFQNEKPDVFNVVCHWKTPGDACEPWERIAVVIAGCLDAQDAANNACLFLIRDRQGMAEASLVIERFSGLFVPDGGIFDAEEFGETITYAGEVIAISELS